MKLDLLVLASHPDDAELSCSGIILSHVAQGKKVGIVDFTMGEMGTRGNPDLRLREAEDSAEILGLSVRENLKFKDALFINDEAHQIQVIKAIRKYRPEIILANAPSDRHVDHGKASRLAVDASFLSGLGKITTEHDGEYQDPWRPKALYHYIQNNYLDPQLIVDISEYWEQKIASIKAYKSQFYNPESDEPDTFISGKNFLEFIEARAREFGHRIGVRYGEGLLTTRYTGVSNLFDLI